MSQTDEAARRTYWAEQMERGYDIVQLLLRHPVEECGEGFASLPEAAKSAGIEMQFSTSKIAGDLERVFFMRESLVSVVMAVGKAMNDRGWILKIEDAFRSLEMQGQLVRKPELFDAILNKCIWENGGEIPSAELVFRRAIVLIANIPKIGTHMSGSAIDVSVFSREDGSEVWRGNHYLEMSERTPMRSPFVEPEALKNRLEITAMLESEGLVHFPYEFWHFNKDDALGHVLRNNPSPARFGPVHWDPKTNRVTAVDNPLTPLNPLPVIQKEIDAALERARTRQGT
ncbi:M15 family metallopeptidase [Schlesneria sp. DSM 10557]|uniref:M15 family metallopeptidase n=1 Tax=Schlesneria sp. DSM 10557 TaxID=3044399 RepID=UPI0035A086C5